MEIRNEIAAIKLVVVIIKNPAVIDRKKKSETVYLQCSLHL